jgi:hypothetical protein
MNNTLVLQTALCCGDKMNDEERWYKEDGLEIDPLDIVMCLFNLRLISDYEFSLMCYNITVALYPVKNSIKKSNYWIQQINTTPIYANIYIYKNK